MKRRPFNDDALITEIDAADFLNCSERTLQNWRSKGTGPAYVLLGRSVRYRPSALIEHIKKRTVVAGQPAQRSRRRR